MPTTEQLRLRALRLLNDGQHHAAAAVQWAADVTGATGNVPPEVRKDARRPRFTLRELSLGAARW